MKRISEILTMLFELTAELKKFNCGAERLITHKNNYIKLMYDIKTVLNTSDKKMGEKILEINRLVLEAEEMFEKTEDFRTCYCEDSKS